MLINLKIDKPMKAGGVGEDCRPIFVTRIIGGKEYCLIAVCDGMGGAGSSLVTINGKTSTQAHFASQTLHDVLIQTFKGIKGDGGNPIAVFESDLRTNMENAFSKLPTSASSNLRGKVLQEFPTTLCAFIFNVANVDENKIFWAGDSRLYAVFTEGIHLVTLDHVADPSEDNISSQPLNKNIAKGKYDFEVADFVLGEYAADENDGYDWGELIGFFVTTDGLVTGHKKGPGELRDNLISTLYDLEIEGYFGGTENPTDMKPFSSSLLDHKEYDWDDDISMGLVLYRKDLGRNIKKLYVSHFNTLPVYTLEDHLKGSEFLLARPRILLLSSTTMGPPRDKKEDDSVIFGKLTSYYTDILNKKMSATKKDTLEVILEREIPAYAKIRKAKTILQQKFDVTHLILSPIGLLDAESRLGSLNLGDLTISSYGTDDKSTLILLTFEALTSLLKYSSEYQRYITPYIYLTNPSVPIKSYFGLDVSSFDYIIVAIDVEVLGSALREVFLNRKPTTMDSQYFFLGGSWSSKKASAFSNFFDDKNSGLRQQVYYSNASSNNQTQDMEDIFQYLDFVAQELTNDQKQAFKQIKSTGDILKPSTPEVMETSLDDANPIVKILGGPVVVPEYLMGDDLEDEEQEDIVEGDESFESSPPMTSTVTPKPIPKISLVKEATKDNIGALVNNLLSIALKPEGDTDSAWQYVRVDISNQRFVASNGTNLLMSLAFPEDYYPKGKSIDPKYPFYLSKKVLKSFAQLGSNIEYGVTYVNVLNDEGYQTLQVPLASASSLVDNKNSENSMDSLGKILEEGFVSKILLTDQSKARISAVLKQLDSKSKDKGYLLFNLSTQGGNVYAPTNMLKWVKNIPTRDNPNPPIVYLDTIQVGYGLVHSNKIGEIATTNPNIFLLKDEKRMSILGVAFYGNDFDDNTPKETLQAMLGQLSAPEKMACETLLALDGRVEQRPTSPNNFALLPIKDIDFSFQDGDQDRKYTFGIFEPQQADIIMNVDSLGLLKFLAKREEPSPNDPHKLIAVPIENSWHLFASDNDDNFNALIRSEIRLNDIFASFDMPIVDVSKIQLNTIPLTDEVVPQPQAEKTETQVGPKQKASKTTKSRSTQVGKEELPKTFGLVNTATKDNIGAIVTQILSPFVLPKVGRTLDPANYVKMNVDNNLFETTNNTMGLFLGLNIPTGFNPIYKKPFKPDRPFYLDMGKIGEAFSKEGSKLCYGYDPNGSFLEYSVVDSADKELIRDSILLLMSKSYSSFQDLLNRWGYKEKYGSMQFSEQVKGIFTKVLKGLSTTKKARQRLIRFLTKDGKVDVKVPSALVTLPSLPNDFNVGTNQKLFTYLDSDQIGYALVRGAKLISVKTTDPNVCFYMNDDTKSVLGVAILQEKSSGGTISEGGYESSSDIFARRAATRRALEGEVIKAGKLTTSEQAAFQEVLKYSFEVDKIENDTDYFHITVPIDGLSFVPKKQNEINSLFYTALPYHPQLNLIIENIDTLDILEGPPYGQAYFYNTSLTFQGITQEFREIMINTRFDDPTTITDRVILLEETPPPSTRAEKPKAKATDKAVSIPEVAPTTKQVTEPTKAKAKKSVYPPIKRFVDSVTDADVREMLGKILGPIRSKDPESLAKDRQIYVDMGGRFFYINNGKKVAVILDFPEGDVKIYAPEGLPEKGGFYLPDEVFNSFTESSFAERKISYIPPESTDATDYGTIKLDEGWGLPTRSFPTPKPPDTSINSFFRDTLWNATLSSLFAEVTFDDESKSKILALAQKFTKMNKQHPPILFCFVGGELRIYQVLPKDAFDKYAGYTNNLVDVYLDLPQIAHFLVSNDRALLWRRATTNFGIQLLLEVGGGSSSSVVGVGSNDSINYQMDALDRKDPKKVLEYWEKNVKDTLTTEEWNACRKVLEVATYLEDSNFVKELEKTDPSSVALTCVRLPISPPNVGIVDENPTQTFLVGQTLLGLSLLISNIDIMYISSTQVTAFGGSKNNTRLSLVANEKGNFKGVLSGYPTNKAIVDSFPLMLDVFETPPQILLASPPSQQEQQKATSKKKTRLFPKNTLMEDITKDNIGIVVGNILEAVRSDEDARPKLKLIHVNMDKKRFEAANGHILAVVNFPKDYSPLVPNTSYSDKRFSISWEAFPSFTEENRNVRLNSDGSMSVIATDTGVEVFRESITEDYVPQESSDNLLDASFVAEVTLDGNNKEKLYYLCRNVKSVTTTYNWKGITFIIFGGKLNVYVDLKNIHISQDYEKISTSGYYCMLDAHQIAHLFISTKKPSFEWVGTSDSQMHFLRDSVSQSIVGICVYPKISSDTRATNIESMVDIIHIINSKENILTPNEYAVCQAMILNSENCFLTDSSFEVIDDLDRRDAYIQVPIEMSVKMVKSDYTDPIIFPIDTKYLSIFLPNTDHLMFGESVLNPLKVRNDANTFMGIAMGGRHSISREGCIQIPDVLATPKQISLLEDTSQATETPTTKKIHKIDPNGVITKDNVGAFVSQLLKPVISTTEVSKRRKFDHIFVDLQNKTFDVYANNEMVILTFPKGFEPKIIESTTNKNISQDDKGYATAASSYILSDLIPVFAENMGSTLQYDIDTKKISVMSSKGVSLGSQNPSMNPRDENAVVNSGLAIPDTLNLVKNAKDRFALPDRQLFVRLDEATKTNIANLRSGIFEKTKGRRIFLEIKQNVPTLYVNSEDITNIPKFIQHEMPSMGLTASEVFLDKDSFTDAVLEGSVFEVDPQYNYTYGLNLLRVKKGGNIVGISKTGNKATFDINKFLEKDRPSIEKLMKQGDIGPFRILLNNTPLEITNDETVLQKDGDYIFYLQMEDLQNVIAWTDILVFPPKLLHEWSDGSGEHLNRRFGIAVVLRKDQNIHGVLHMFCESPLIQDKKAENT